VIKLIEAAEVKRDDDGYWYHPDEPDFDEDIQKYNAWLEEQGLEIRYKSLEDEGESHPAHARYWPDNWEDGSPNVSDWHPDQPAGDGWFTLSIHDTEDGPVWVWVRRKADFKDAS